ncbi:Metallo-dependent phosphatase-like protein [Boletus edulis BED1]|uniref:Metallo-dependent phosphatase-like protein n=1 Tax=Boletus edulis BED1 TaxID=1328754 RepID=A0AAD4G691_BOLED|nr:Metallo-dependent phosphatase-like protein [Boletus edulis BED1]KAF8430700.1 Metallo-dependent phosphatase-like protein [Boletus edulis BED1]
MLFSLFSLVGLTVACADNGLLARDTHVHAKREYPQFPLTPPYRPLPWGDFNVIHTTDTHGWLLGHQNTPWPEPNYSGDLGDFASFVTHMKQIAIEKDVDLLLVDSGDLHDGTGLSDGYPPGGVDAHESNKFLERLPYDLMTIGNHELYIYADTYDMYTNFVPHLNGRYLSSNANITILNSDGEAVSVPVGNRYVKFTTRKGRSVTSFGVLYDFTGNSVNTTVQLVADMVKEQWFAEAIAEEPDVFVLVGHMPVSHDNWPVVFNAIRAVHPCTPILIFGGHSHIRDCQQYDGRTMALESGRYMETIGWMSANLDAAVGNTNNITFNRRYLDQNRVTYEYHTTTSNSTFDTIYGRNITYDLQQLAIDFDLSYFYGNAPLTYTMNQNPYPSSENVLTLFVAEAAPVALAINNTRANVPNIIITNSGELRYNVFVGPFTKNDQLTAAPFTDSFYYIPNVTLSVANQVLPALNGGSNTKRSEVEKALWGRGWVESRYRNWLQDMQERQIQMANATNLTLGYVTIDGCPGTGDDTLHIPLPYYSVPDYIASNSPNVTGDTPIDLIFVDFIESEVLGILNSVQSTTNYTSADVSLYTPTLADAVLGLYAQAIWN